MERETYTVGRKRKKNGFTQVSNSLLEDDRISWKAKGILCYLLSRPDNWKINRSDIQKRATDGRESMVNGINELKEIGYLHIYQNVLENGKFGNWIWEYDDVPFITEERENRLTENQQETAENLQVSRKTENPNFGKPELRKTRHYNNTDFNNTDLNNTKSKEHLKHMTISPEKPSRLSIENEFEHLWRIYPRKEGKKKARESYEKARKKKKVSYETIENGLYRYIRHLEEQGTDEQFIQYGSSWFNQERWQDEYITSGVQKKPKNAVEYFRAKYSQGDDRFEPDRNGKNTNTHSELLSEFF